MATSDGDAQMGVNDPNELDVALFQANVQVLIAIAPHLARQLENHQPQSKLVKGADGQWDVEFRGATLYGEHADRRLEADMAKIKAAAGSRFALAPISSRNLDSVTGNFVYGLLRRTTELGIEFNERQLVPDAYHLVSFGFGLGRHLKPMMDVAQPRSVCIVESNLDFLYHSLFVFDWQPLLDLVLQYGRRFVSVHTCAGATEMARSVRHHLRFACPVAVDGSIIYLAYPSDNMLAAGAELGRDAHLISIGLGFVHDEMEMTRASYKNFRDGDFRLFHHNNVMAQVPAFIVGSGPSIDEDIETIKACQDKAVIFSCGTAGRVLVANGIQPDFELILENGTNPYLALQGAHEQFGFEKAVLIASNTVDPRLKTLFKESVFFCRQALSSYAMFNMGPNYALDNPGPTVVNTGLSAALAMGFRELYLFGVDLGTRSKDRHHSRDSVYRHADDDKEGVKGAFDYTDDYPSVEVANFGGLMHTDMVMSWTRDTLVTSIATAGASCRVFNCSDGMLIPRTTPMSSSSIKIKTTAEDKRKVVEAAVACFPRGSKEDIHQRWTRENWLESIRELGDRVIAAIDPMPTDKNELLHRISNLMIRDHERMPTHAEFFMRGTVMMMAMTMDYYWKRVNDKSRIEEFIAIASEEFARSINFLVQQSAWFFENLEDFESYEDLEARAKEWVYE